jgi:hypothetical protein
VLIQGGKNSTHLFFGRLDIPGEIGITLDWLMVRGMRKCNSIGRHYCNKDDDPFESCAQPPRYYLQRMAGIRPPQENFQICTLSLMVKKIISHCLRIELENMILPDDNLYHYRGCEKKSEFHPKKLSNAQQEQSM